MSQNTPSPPENPVTEVKSLRLFSTAEVKDILELESKYGCITKIDPAPEGSREESLLIIACEEEREEYDFKGLGAYEAATDEDRKVGIYQRVLFFTYKKTVVGILINE